MDLAAAKERIKQLESRLKQFEQVSDHVLGHPSTFPDRSYQLQLTPFINRAAQLQPNSGVYTKIESGYSFQSYKNIAIKGKRLASALNKFGIGVGDVVGTFMWNNGRHFLLHYTVACMGSVLNALNFRLFPRDLVYIINHVRDKIIFIDSVLLPIFEQIPFNQLQTIKALIVCGPNEAPGNWQTDLSNVTNVIDFDTFISRGDPDPNAFKWPSIDERSGLGVCFTSGTTGRPKGVVYSHRSSAIHLLTCLINDFLSIKGTDCWLPLAPMFHAFAWLIPFHALCIGYKVVLSNNYSDAETHMNMIYDHKVTVYSGVPTVLQSLRAEYEKNPNKYNKIKGVLTRIMTGGSAPPPDLVNWYRNTLNIDVVQIWGMTELNPFGSYGRRLSRRLDLNKSDDELLQNQLCCGIPFPTLEMKIVDETDYEVELPWDGKSIGELLVRGHSVCDSYFKVSQEILNKKFYRGWLVTGDLGLRSKTGQLILKDRSKDMIKSGGEWISSVDMENHIMGFDGVDKACVVAAKHTKWMQRPIVIIELKDGISQDQCSLENIRKHCQKRFAKWWGPDDVLYWDEIPLTGTGKMSKKDARAKLDKIGYKHPQERNKSKL